MLTQYNINSFINGVNAFGAPFCKTIYTATLAATTDTSLTVPSISAKGTFPSVGQAKILAVFSYEAAKKVYVALNAAASVPAGAAFAASTSELNPPAKVVQAGDVIHFYGAAIADVSVAFYQIG